MNFESLEKLDLSGCASIENAVNLRTLDIIAELLLTNINLESLDVLNLRDCSMLKSFPQISTNIRALDLRGTAVEEVPPSIVSWPRLDQLQMSYFENLKECPHALERITWLCLTDTEIREVPPWVKKISRLNGFVPTGFGVHLFHGCKRLRVLGDTRVLL
ncbi:hypothetical protein F2Q70_00001978 [Brassica cretica]|uniref:Uncharacterized protein n=1 Tax=Brassica cretica TaxID=69181 RepID=A0A8S9J027_BRACR|nr:hypothetical protein F2Q70_00001978 [Brassica cretica]